MSVAFVMISTEPGNLESLQEAIKKVVGVEEVYKVYGVYDFMVKVRAANVEELKDLVVYHLRRLGKVVSTTTMIVTDKLATKREMVLPA